MVSLSESMADSMLDLCSCAPPVDLNSTAPDVNRVLH
jgi:hypothetical protein